MVFGGHHAYVSRAVLCKSQYLRWWFPGRA